ncbi:MAG: type II toxin-antitoxin system VapC family toxin [Chloroflexi bacterium]|nr:type II toxin-antitoxin system VapC family toxin [Chloroflexota bacterium]
MLVELLAAADTFVIEFGQWHWRVAVSAWGRFGTGRHPAGVNFGDCLAFAVAQVAREPLLAKGDDFARTDIPLA